MSCDEVRISLGAYVLGALPAAEADAVRDHVDRCQDCSAELAELAGLPRLLAMVPGAEVGAGSRTGRHAATPPPSEAPRLEKLLERAAAEQTRGRTRSRIMAGLSAAAAALVVLIGAAVFSSGSPGSPVVAPTQQPPGTFTLSAHESTGEWAQLHVTPKGWGTLVSISLGGVDPGQTCRLEAVGEDGEREVASTWQVPFEGYTAESGSITIPGAVGLSASDIDRYEVITTTGEHLITIQNA